MHADARKNLLTLSRLDNPVAKCAASAAEAGMVVPSILRKNLEAAGYRVTDAKLKVLTQVKVHKDGRLVACGSSSDAADALLQAVHAHLREVSGQAK